MKLKKGYVRKVSNSCFSLLVETFSNRRGVYLKLSRVQGMVRSTIFIEEGDRKGCKIMKIRLDMFLGRKGWDSSSSVEKNRAWNA